MALTFHLMRASIAHTLTHTHPRTCSTSCTYEQTKKHAWYSTLRYPLLSGPKLHYCTIKQRWALPSSIKLESHCPKNNLNLRLGQCNGVSGARHTFVNKCRTYCTVYTVAVKNLVFMSLCEIKFFL